MVSVGSCLDSKRFSLEADHGLVAAGFVMSLVYGVSHPDHALLGGALLF